MKKISFFITFYNQEKYVYNTLSSILNLHLPFEYEILIGDDNSTDNTISRIEEFKKEYNLHNIYVYFNHQK